VIVEARARAAWRWTCTDVAASWAFRAAVALTVPVMYIVGRNQWFIRDDWAFVLTRDEIRTQVGWQEWLFLPTIGHWMTVPLLVYRVVQGAFGLDSYWPFLVVNMAIHIGIVLAVRAICRRVGARAWTTTLVCAGLLVFGPGWENIVFAVQITYGLSMLGFLCQVLLVDHDGPPDWRDAAGSALALVGVMSSGFGPFFVVGIAVLLVLRRRWISLAVAVAPQVIALAWWWLAWGRDSPEESTSGGAGLVPGYAMRGVVAVFDGLIGFPGLGLLGALATFALALWRGHGWRTQSLLVTLWVTAAIMYLGLGSQRGAFGVENAAISRYQDMGAMLLAPVFALLVDQLRRLAPEAAWAGRVMIALAIVLNAAALRTNSSAWAARSADERRILELVAGSGLAPAADPERQPLEFSPDVRVRHIDMLVDAGAITPRAPATPEELALVRAVLGLPPG
jgi:hypothetical protein